MPTKVSTHQNDLRRLIPAALRNQPDQEVLEAYIAEHSNLPGPRGNLELIGAFADVIGEIITLPDPPVERIEALLDGWAALPLDSAPVNDPRELLPCVAVMSYGQAAASRPDWWQDEMTKLHRAASSPRWRTREIVAAALQRALDADWDRTLTALNGWLTESDALVIRAVAAAVAEPRLLKAKQHAEDAVTIQQGAIEWLAAQPAPQRKTEDVRTLRQALGYTVSVAVAAAPETGFRLLERLAKSDDADLCWIARENLKKNRLSAWADQVTELQALLA